MKDLDKFVLYDPMEANGTSSIPDAKGCYLIVLRLNATFIECKKIAIAPKLTSIDVLGTSYSVVYVGETKSLRDEYENNFLGKVGNNSSFWKSIGCLMGYTLYQGDTSSATGAFSKFSVAAEKGIKKWITENLLFLYCADEGGKCTEQEMINAYNPPLNLLNNSNKVNSQYRKKLSELRNISASKTKGVQRSRRNEPQNDMSLSVNVQKEIADMQKRIQERMQNQKRQNVFCPRCGASLVVPDGLKDEKKLSCSICGASFSNPLYGSNKGETKDKITLKKGIIFIAVVILIGIWLVNAEVSPDTNRHGAVRYYLKYHYLKDPDSYQSIDWNTTQSGDKIYVRHRFRAKNSFGGYVVEEKTFIFDTEGNLKEIVD